MFLLTLVRCFQRERATILSGFGWVLFPLFLVSARADEGATTLHTLLPRGLAESQLFAINQAGVAVGNCEIFDATGASVSSFGCMFSRGAVTAIPKLEGYRKMEIVALSDSGLAVGHAYSPAAVGVANLRAVVFDSSTGAVLGLPNWSETGASVATSISADGQRIAGSCGGQAALWSRQAGEWSLLALPKLRPDSASLRVLLSDSGEIAIASQRDPAMVQLVQWSLSEGNAWKAFSRQDSDLSPYDINDSGVVVGSATVRVGGQPATRGFVLRPDSEVEWIEPLSGDNFSIARAINAADTVVGWSDAVGDPTRRPRSFIMRGRTTALLQLSELAVAHQAFAINARGEIVGLLEREEDPHCVGFCLASEPVFSGAPLRGP